MGALFTFVKGLFTGYSLTEYLVIGLFLASLFGYVFYLKYENAEKDKTIALQAVQVQLDSDTIDLQKKSIAAIQAINQNLDVLKSKDAAQSANQAAALLKLSKALNDNPELVAIAVNKATHNRLRCMELATGSASLKKETNPICPQLLPSVTK